MDNQRGWVKSITHQTTSGTVQQTIAYTYDGAGNPLTYTDSIAGGQSWSTSYVHDRANRLTSEIRTGGSSANFNVQYAYDQNGNRTTVTRNGATTTYSVDNNDRFLSGDGYSVSASNYDADGNPLAIAGPSSNMTNTFDADSKLTQISYSAGGSDTFVYNGDGQRVQRVDNSGTRRFVYDGSAVVAETDGTGAVQAYHVPGVGYVDASGAQHYYRENGIGSNVAVTSSTGAVESITEYDAYGQSAVVQSGNRSSLRFAGKHGYISDDHSGMQMLGARYYLPVLGRFLTQDPLGHEAGPNLYEYCANSPLVKIDPDGTDAKTQSDWENNFNNPGYAPRPTFSIPGYKYTMSVWVHHAHWYNNRAHKHKRLNSFYVGNTQLWFFNLVSPGGVMDFKRLLNGKRFDQSIVQNAIDFGNYNYGVIGRAAGISADFLLDMAAQATRLTNGGRTATPTSSKSRGDQPRDAFFIRQGIYDYDHGMYGKRN